MSEEITDIPLLDILCELNAKITVTLKRVCAIELAIEDIKENVENNLFPTDPKLFKDAKYLEILEKQAAANEAVIENYMNIRMMEISIQKKIELQKYL